MITDDVTLRLARDRIAWKNLYEAYKRKFMDTGWKEEEFEKHNKVLFKPLQALAMVFTGLPDACIIIRFSNRSVRQLLSKYWGPMSFTRNWITSQFCGIGTCSKRVVVERKTEIFWEKHIEILFYTHIENAKSKICSFHTIAEGVG